MIMTKKSTQHAVEADKLAGFEAAVLQAVKAGLLKPEAVEAVIVKAGFNVSAEEHAACKPVSAKEQAAQALAAYGVNVETITAQPANVKSLHDALKGLWLEIEPDKSQDKQGTAFCNYYITQCIKAGKAIKKAELLAYVQKEYRSHYVNVGHYATWLARLKAEKVKHVKGNGFFQITA
jgi:hypothetical protein